MKKIILLQFFLLNIVLFASAQCWKSVSAGTGFSIGIKSDGTLWEWGTSQFIGSFTYTNVPAQLGTDNDWEVVSAGSDHCVAIKTDGSLWAWGNNQFGQIGDGTTVAKNLPAHIGIGSNWKSASAGTSHSLAIKTDGTLWAWGFNGSGELGIIQSYLLIPVQVGTDTWNYINAGTFNSFGIKTNGTLWAWGNDMYSQLGDLDNVNKTVPLQIGTDNDWKQVKGGITHTLALKTGGTLWAWGDNTYGQLGDGTNVQRPVPKQIGSSNNWEFVGASIGTGNHYSPYGPGSDGSHSAAIKNDGTLWVWGLDYHGQLGDGTNVDKNIPTQIGSNINWKLVSAGFAHTVALQTDGTAYTWGNNTAGQLGDSSKADKNMPVPLSCTRPTPAINCWQTISSGYTHSLGLKSDGTLWAWGVNQYAVFGNGTVSFVANIPEQTNTDTDWATVSAGQTHTLALKSNGTLWAWGHNDSGQLGDGTYNTRYAPVQIGTATNWQSVSAGQAHRYVFDYEHSLAIKNDGTMWSWGENNYGQLGDGSNISKNVPQQIAVGTTWHVVSAGEDYSLAIKSDGTLWAWGRNDSGELGDGTYGYKNLPVQIGTGANWKFISAGWEHSIAIKTDGTLWAWGNNHQGQLGDGTVINRNLPTQIGTANNWVSASSGGNFSLGVQTDGSLWSWGYNDEGQLGDGTVGSKVMPSRIDTTTNWKYTSAGIESSFAIKTDGSLWSWGYDIDGELGDGYGLAQNTLPHLIKCEVTAAKVLPIKLVSFNAQKQESKVLLNWQTAMEQNNKEFQLERKAEGGTFENIGIVASQNNISGSTYTYTDAYPLSGNNYYRLKSVDIDGKFSYSNIVKINFSLAVNHVIVYPNPAKDILNIQSNFKGESLYITIADLVGRKILQTMKPNNQLIHIPVATLKTGFYLLKVSDGSTSISKKIIKD